MLIKTHAVQFVRFLFPYRLLSYPNFGDTTLDSQYIIPTVGDLHVNTRNAGCKRLQSDKSHLGESRLTFPQRVRGVFRPSLRERANSFLLPTPVVCELTLEDSSHVPMTHYLQDASRFGPSPTKSRTCAYVTLSGRKTWGE